MNNGCDDILICRDRDKLDKATVIDIYDRLISIKYGDVTGEPHYARVQLRVMVEELFDINKQSINTSSLIDYKVWYLNGRPYCIWCTWNRGKEGADIGIYDLDWSYHPEWSIFTEHYRQGKEILPKPKRLEHVLEVASKLSEESPILRVNLYEVNEKIYFGKLTLTLLGRPMDYLTSEVLSDMGSRIRINEIPEGYAHVKC